MIVSWFGFIRPEYILYAVLVGTFTAGAFGVFLIARKHLALWQSFIVGLAAIVNPVIFYKYTAGHVDYLIAYAIFIYFAYYLLYKYKPSLRSAFIVGLFMAFVGIQIQFFAIAGLFWVGYMLFNRKQWKPVYIAIVVGIALAINMVWLSNFIFGGANVADISETATKGSFGATSTTQYLNIFNFTFSKATLISRFYSTIELLIYVAGIGLAIKLLAFQKKRQLNDILLVSFLLLMIFMATGLFQRVNLGPINTLYPMFREVGHFAPIIWLISLLLIVRIDASKRSRWFGVALLLAAIGVSTYKFVAYPQAVNFSDVRKQFQEFHDFDNAHNSTEYRSLAYPFFDQYAFVKYGNNAGKALPMSNTGHDSFTAFANGQFIKSGVKPQDFKESVQYKLLTTKDVDVLQPYNIRYLYDFTDIYESNYNKYVPTTTYDGKLSLIKNDKHFFDELLKNNKGKLRRVSPHVLEVTNYTSRLSVSSKVYSTDSSDAGDASLPLIQNVVPDIPFIYASPGQTKVANMTPLATPYNLLTSNVNANSSTKTLEQTIPTIEGNSNLYSSNKPTDILYRTTANQLVIYEKKQSVLQIDNQVADSQDTEKVIATQTLVSGSDYFITANNAVVPISRNSQGKVGAYISNQEIGIYRSTGSNAVNNGSFESGLWKQTVDDCNNFDNNGKLDMRLDTKQYMDGKQSLVLAAGNHTACTSTQFALKGDVTYLLSYGYQSSNASVASSYLNFNDSDKQAMKQRNVISDDQWHTVGRIFTTSSDVHNGRLFLHAAAVPGSKEMTVNRYDEVSVMPVEQVGDVRVTDDVYTYAKQPINKSGTSNFKLSVEGYDYTNLLKNGSFESGLWQKEVTDCNDYDDNASIAMTSDSTTATNGKKSLQLSAKHHYACTYTSVAVKPNTNYQVSFRYRGKNAQKAGYYVKFDDPETTAKQDQVSVTDKSWHTYSDIIRTPDDVTSLKLFLNAYERPDGKINSVNYDDVKVVEFPPVDNRYYVITEPTVNLQTPKFTEAKTVNESKRALKVSDVKTPFFVLLSENYHPAWVLQSENVQNTLSSILPVSAAAHNNGNHFEYNNYGNGWYIDPVGWCSQYPAGCTKNNDGSYDMAMVMNFVPQRWFNVSVSVSVLTLIGCLTYVTLGRNTDKQAKYTYRKK